MKLRYTLYSMGVSFLLFGCAPYIGECRYPVVKLDQVTSIEKRAFLGGRCRGTLIRVPTVYTVNKDEYTLKLIVGAHQYPVLFLVAMDQYGDFLDIQSKNIFFYSVNDSDYFKLEQVRIKKETGYLVSHVYDIQKELVFATTHSDSRDIEIGINMSIDIDILRNSKALDSHLIEYKVDSFKHFAIETI